MLDLKFIRENIDVVKESINKRNLKLDLSVLTKLDDSRRKVLVELEELRSQRNKANNEISVLLKEKNFLRVLALFCVFLPVICS